MEHLMTWGTTTEDLGELIDPTLDLQFGNGDCDFELSHNTPGTALAESSVISIDGTEYGGIVDGIRLTVADGHTQTTVTGRTWHGILAGKIIQPDQGSDRLTVSGDANDVIRAIIKRIGLEGLFTVETEPAGADIDGYGFHRYIDAYNGLRMMLDRIGMRLDIRHTNNRTLIAARPTTTYDGVDSDLSVDFEAVRQCRVTNHLIGLGKGELRNRAVSHWYADHDGNVSQKQSQYGPDEITDIYELTGSEGSDLSDKTRDKLKESQTAGTIDVDLPRTEGLHVDDRINAYDADNGIRINSRVIRKIIKITEGTTSVDYEAGATDWPDDQE